MHVIIAVVLLVVLVVLVVTTARSYRRGGYGPAIRMSAWTKAGRMRTNRFYAKHGWAEPYDDEGNMLPKSQRTLPDDVAS